VNAKVQAILWDFGGVVTTSPFEAFSHFEADRGLPDGFLQRVNSVNPDANAWARFERNAISAEAFDEAFAEESRALGAEVRGRDVLGLLYGDVRPEMVAALTFCKGRFKLGCITNNVAVTDEARSGAVEERLRAHRQVFALFDHVIESSKAGVRKPDPASYRMMTEALDVAPEACVYLDDLGINLKPAKAIGMRTIKVAEPEPALQALEQALGLDLPRTLQRPAL